VLRVAALVGVAGCQVVFPYEGPSEPSACGRFVVDEEQVFADLVDVVEFSVNADATLGFAKGIRTGDSAPLLFPIAREGGAWRVDDARIPVGGANRLDLELQQMRGVREGRSAPSGELFAGALDLVGDTGSSRVQHLQLGVNGWTVQLPEPTVFVQLDATVPGGVAEVPADFGIIRQLPVLHRPAAGERFLSVLTQFDNTSMATEWDELTDGGVLATEPINAAHEHIDQASIAVGPNTRVVIAYQASDNGRTELFLTEKQFEVFPPGVPLDLGDAVEPFLSPDCKALYFRRGTQIFRAISDSP
jgi:hypothetical protein